MYFCNENSIRIMSLADFIQVHAEDDPVRLLLSRDKLQERYPDLDLDLAVTTLEVRRKLRNKVPEWYAVPSLVYPSRLSGEQCSSSETARYKALVAVTMVSGGSVVPKPSLRDPSQNKFWAPRRVGDRGPRKSLDFWGGLAEGGHRFWDHTAPGNERCRIADLTGGMGVDAWAFAQVAGEVLYNEMQGELERATELNFRELGVENVQFGNRKVEPGKVKEVLDGFEPDLIYLDPARRAEDGRKVFLIEDCRPDVLALQPELFEASRFVMLKLSPMADISMACKRLEHVREVHVVASGGECKELLFVLDREWEGLHSVVVVEGGTVMEIPGHPSTSSGTAGNDGGRHGRPDRPSHDVRYGVPKSGNLLFEPGKALAKAGAFGLPCERFGMTKLGLHTHLYVGEAVPEGLEPYGKWFEVLEVLPLNNRTMKEIGKRYPQAEVTARNIPMTSDVLRRKIGCVSGGDVHLFGVRMDGVAEAGNYLMITKRNIDHGND